MLRYSLLASTLVALGSLFVATGPARAGMVCSDMDGDGTAETCIETRDTDGNGRDDQANFPGQPPPEVPDPGEGKPVDPDPPEATPPPDDDDDSGSSDDDDGGDSGDDD